MRYAVFLAAGVLLGAIIHIAVILALPALAARPVGRRPPAVLRTARAPTAHRGPR